MEIDSGAYHVISPFGGKSKGYDIDTYYSGKRTAFTAMPEYAGLIDAVTDLYLCIYPTRDREISIERMRKWLSHPRTILMLVLNEDIPVGFGIFPRLIVDRERVLYSSRALLPEHEGQHVGTHLLDKAIRLYQEELARTHSSLHWGVLMTQSAFSIVTLKKLQREGNIGTIFPVDEPYDHNRDAQSVLLAVYREVYLRSLSIDTITGVSRGELGGLGMNEAYRPSREHQEAYKIHQRMVSSPPDGWDMNRERGDVVYVTFELKRPNGTATGIPSTQVV